MTILTKQIACDEKAPVKIAIPPEQSESVSEESDSSLNNNNIVYVSRLLIRLMFFRCWLECWRNRKRLGLSIDLLDCVWCVVWKKHPPFTPSFYPSTVPLESLRLNLKNRFQFVLPFYSIDIEFGIHRSFGNRKNCHSFKFNGLAVEGKRNEHGKIWSHGKFSTISCKMRF